MPQMTSSMSEGSRPGTLDTTSAMMNADMSSGRTSAKDPLTARPMGVREVADYERL